jgi:hypothetical protein
VSVASAQAARHAPPPSIEQQAAAVKAQDAYTPADGNKELNVNVLEDQVEHYYGSASATYPRVGTVTIPSSTSNYAKQMKQIVAGAEIYTIVSDFGDQYSDLLGGDAGHQVKLPNPMYYIPGPPRRSTRNWRQLRSFGARRRAQRISATQHAART